MQHELNMHIEKLDGTLVEFPDTIKYAGQLNDWAVSQLRAKTDPEVYITVWKHSNGEVRKKFYSSACWNIDAFAIEMFESMCKDHDWYFEYSDDHRVWKAGRSSYSELFAKYNGMIKKYPAVTSAIWKMYNPFIKEQEPVNNSVFN